ncbi:MAG: hypothetical protein ACTSRA_09880 [Promethearchaeota archaeon]
MSGNYNEIKLFRAAQASGCRGKGFLWHATRVVVVPGQKSSFQYLLNRSWCGSKRCGLG